MSIARLGRLTVLLLSLSLAQSLSALAQTTAPAPLPPAAQEALNKGVVAAKVPDFLLAIRYFEEARKIAPYAPQIYFNLGLAESKISGRELRAIAWFGAYLAAYPNAPNAAVVKDQIAVLDVKNQSNVSKLIKSVQEAAGQTLDYRGPHLIDVTELWLKAGDISAALRTAALVQDESPLTAGPYKSIALWNVATTQAEAGDIAGATKTTNLILDAKWKSKAQFAIGQSQIKSGDIVGGQNTLATALAVGLKAVDLIERDHGAKNSALLEIAVEGQAKAGDFVGALKTADLILDDADYKRLVQSYIAEAQMKAGDFMGAQTTLASTLKTADLIQDTKRKTEAQLSIAYGQNALVKSQIEAGDIAGAQKTANLIQDEGWKSKTQFDVAEAQSKRSDIGGAQTTANFIRDEGWKGRAQIAIAEAQAKAALANAPNSTRQSPSDTPPPIQPRIEVSNWLYLLDKDGVNTAPFLDLTGYLKSMPCEPYPSPAAVRALGAAGTEAIYGKPIPRPSDYCRTDPNKILFFLSETALKIVRAQNSIQQMLKHQAQQPVKP